MAVSWSHSNQLLLTGSADRTACVWQLSDPKHPVALSLTTTSHNFKKPTDTSIQVLGLNLELLEIRSKCIAH